MKILYKAGSMPRSTSWNFFLVKTKLLIQVNFWEGESDVTKILEVWGQVLSRCH